MTAMAAQIGESSARTGGARPGAVVRAVAFAWVISAILLIGVLALAGRADWWRGGAAATVVTLMASIATIPIIQFAVRIGRTRPELAAGAFFVAAGVRAGISLGAAIVAVRYGGYPKMPTLLMVVPFYFALLAAETIVLARALWTRDRTERPHHGSQS